MRHLTHQGLPIRLPFARNDKVGILDHSIKVGNIKHNVYARMQLGIQISKEGVAKSASCSGTRTKGKLGSGTSCLLGLLCKSAQPPVKQLHLLGRSTLLRGKDISSPVLAKQGIVDVASYNHPTVHIETSAVAQSLNHATSPIAGSATSNAHNDCLATALHGIGYHFAHTISGGSHGVALFLRHERQSACCRHFHIGGLAACRNCIFSLYPIH